MRRIAFGILALLLVAGCALQPTSVTFSNSRSFALDVYWDWQYLGTVKPRDTMFMLAEAGDHELLVAGNDEAEYTMKAWYVVVKLAPGDQHQVRM